MRKRVRKNGYLLVNENGKFMVVVADTFYTGLITSVYRTRKEMIEHLRQRLVKNKKEMKKARELNIPYHLRTLKEQKEAYKFFIYTLLTNKNFV